MVVGHLWKSCPLPPEFQLPGRKCGLDKGEEGTERGALGPATQREEQQREASRGDSLGKTEDCTSVLQLLQACMPGLVGMGRGAPRGRNEIPETLRVSSFLGTRVGPRESLTTFCRSALPEQGFFVRETLRRHRDRRAVTLNLRVGHSPSSRPSHPLWSLQTADPSPVLSLPHPLPQSATPLRQKQSSTRARAPPPPASSD